MTDHVAMIIVDPDADKEDSGVKGMKWGIRRDRTALKAAAAKRKTESEKKPDDSSTKKPSGNIQDHVESSAERYARLSAHAKSGKASDMTDQDLKFFNARTEALNKIQKLNESDPSWLSKTSKKVVQTTAERQMQSLSDTLADKYIGKPIADAIKGAAKKD